MPSGQLSKSDRHHGLAKVMSQVKFLAIYKMFFIDQLFPLAWVAKPLPIDTSVQDLDACRAYLSESSDGVFDVGHDPDVADRLSWAEAVSAWQSEAIYTLGQVDVNHGTAKKYRTSVPTLYRMKEQWAVPNRLVFAFMEKPPLITYEGGDLDRAYGAVRDTMRAHGAL